MIGSGGYATVMKVQDKVTRTDFAAKVFKKTDKNYDEGQILKEAEICKKLRHQNIV